MLSLRLCVLVALTVGGALAAFDPYVAGPYSPGYLLIGAATQENLPTDVSVYLPDGAPGTYPVIIFLTEFQGKRGGRRVEWVVLMLRCVCCALLPEEIFQKCLDNSHTHLGI